MRFLLLFLLMPSIAFSATLEEVLKHAINNSTEIKIQRQYLESADIERKAAYSEYLPDVYARASYGRKQDEYDGNDNRYEDEQQESIHLNQTLFQGFAGRNKVKQAGYIYKAAENNFYNFSDEHTVKVIDAFYQLHTARKVLEVATYNKTLAEKVTDQVKLKKNRISSTDAINYDIEYANVISDYQNALENLSLAENNYINRVGTLHNNLEFNQIPNLSTQDLNIQELAENSKPVQAKYNEYLAAKYHKHSKYGNLSPIVSLEATASRQKNVAYLADRDLKTKSIYLGVTLPIYKKGVQYNNIDKAKSDYIVKQEEYVHIKKLTERELQAMFAQFELQNKIHNNNLQLFAKLDEKFERNKVNFRVGVIDKISYYKSLIERNNVLIKKMNSEAKRNILYYKIKILTGNLDIA